VTTIDEKSPVKNLPDGATLSREQRIALLSRKLERFRESHDKKDKAAREWIAEMERELEDLKSSLVS
jgi:hypothetical protein